MKKILSTQPQKGYPDWDPKEYAIQKYIFETWRKVCKQFGYEEYLTPLMESAEIYRAKSGEDVGGKELMSCIDRAGRELAIRPEMTPSVTRLVAKNYSYTPKPIRYFSIANFIRNERPQRGRTREFWQLNYDIFGSDSIVADLEIVQIAIEIMLALKAPKGSFTTYINDRRLIDYVIEQILGNEKENRQEIVRILDKWDKYDKSELEERLKELNLNKAQIEILSRFADSKDEKQLLANFPDIAENEGYKNVMNIFEMLKSLGYEDYISFNPSIIRGFDYYDGLVFEVFDKNPENSRSMFGGGRYNGLASLFGKESFPAVGCAPGNVTTRLFLESWNLLPNHLLAPDFFVTIFDDKLISESFKVANILRKEGKNVEISTVAGGLGKQISYAQKKGIQCVVILGEEELRKGIFLVKDLNSGEQVEREL